MAEHDYNDFRFEPHKDLRRYERGDFLSVKFFENGRAVEGYLLDTPLSYEGGEIIGGSIRLLANHEDVEPEEAVRAADEVFGSMTYSQKAEYGIMELNYEKNPRMPWDIRDVERIESYSKESWGSAVETASEFLGWEESQQEIKIMDFALDD